MYYQAIDLVIAAINNCFNQADYDIYAKLEQVLLLAATNGNYSRELTEVTEFYKDDFNKSDLETQLEILSQMKIDCAGDSITFSRYLQTFKRFVSFSSCFGITSDASSEVCFTYASHQCHV